MLGQLKMVFKRAEITQFTDKVKKYLFFQYRVVFLGYVLSAEDIFANEEKVDKIQNWLVSFNPKELRPFIGAGIIQLLV